MTIYTRFGDTGETSLCGGRRTRKDDLRIEVCGGIDELSASLGLVRTELAQTNHVPPHWETFIDRIQHELIAFCTEIVSAEKPANAVSAEHVARLEEEIDRIEAALPPLKQFVIPGANRLSALLHVARTVCRRGERTLTALSHGGQEHPILAAYLNRLSDLLFMLARAAGMPPMGIGGC